MTVSYLVQERPLVLRSDAHNNMFLGFHTLFDCDSDGRPDRFVFYESKFFHRINTE